jgi:hypothetical protein
MISSYFARKQQATTPYTENVNIVVGDGDVDRISASTKGLMVSTIFAAAYFIRPIHMALPVLMIVYGNLLVRLFAHFLLLIIVVSSFTPPRPLPIVVDRLLSPMLEYFQYDEIIENSPIHIQESIVDGKQYIFACQPHGIIPYCSIAWSIRQARNQRKIVPTAVASLVLYTPLLKHVMGMFGCVTAATMRKQLQTKEVPCVRLYVGSTTEIFYCDDETETLHLTKRKKFIKIALQMGVDVIPVYMFGNTAVYSPLKHPVLIKLSDWFQFPCTWVFGRYYLPIPKKQKVSEFFS